MKQVENDQFENTELIRLSHSYNDTKHVHIEPAEADYMVQRMGIYRIMTKKLISYLCE